MSKLFVTSVANAYIYNTDKTTLLAVGKTLLDTSINTTLGKTDVRAGRGNQLQYVYYHTAEMEITISDAQWNLDFLKLAVGSDITQGTVDIWKEESVKLSATGVGTLLVGTAVLISGAVIYGWATLANGSTARVVFSAGGQAFTIDGGVGAKDETVCVRYYSLDTAARSITIDANMIPDVVHIALEAQLNSSDETTNQVGYVQIDVPKASLSGAFSIKMTPDGVASTPITARALASTDTTTGACENGSYYATIKEIISAANWYDNVIAIGIEGGDISFVHATTHTVYVYAVPSTGLPFICPVTGTEMTFASGTTATATFGTNTGILTGVTTGTSVIHAYITAKPAMDAYVTATVT